MLKQVLVSVLVLIVAVAGYVYFVPGADVMVRNLGLTMPFPTAYGAAAAQTPAPGGNAPGGNRQASAAGATAGQNAANPPGRPGGRAQTPTVITAPVTTSTINDKLTAIGQGVATQSVSVTTQATGTLQTLAVAPGDTVKAGQVIGQLDSDAEQIAFDKANLTVKDAADTVQRTQTLAKTSNATTVQLSTAQLALDNANLELRNAKLALDKRSIVTPIDGRIGLFQVTPGNAVGADTVVTTVDDTSSILVNYWVPERYAPVVKIGMPVSAQALALPSRNFDGKVSAVDSRIDPTSRTLQVQARIPNAGGDIKAGMSFEVSMGFPGDTYPAVDPLAIQWASDGSFVWFLTADSKVKKNKVQIIQRNSDGVLVHGDLKPGDQVVTQGVLQLADGATVRRLDDSSAGAGPGGKPASTAPATGGTADAGPAPTVQPAVAGAVQPAAATSTTGSTATSAPGTAAATPS